MILFLDTETTGLRPGEICQLSYVMQDKNSTTAKNFFFKVDYVEAGAQAVHGFSVEKLNQLSGGKDFSHFIDEIEKDFSNADVISSHNVAFDFMFLRIEFERLGREFKYLESFCSMKKFTPICKLKRKSGEGYKYPRLSELSDFLGISGEEIQKETSRLFGGCLGYHDARYDTVAVYLAINKAIKIGSDIWGLEKFL